MSEDLRALIELLCDEGDRVATDVYGWPDGNGVIATSDLRDALAYISPVTQAAPARQRSEDAPQQDDHDYRRPAHPFAPLGHCMTCGVARGDHK